MRRLFVLPLLLWLAAPLSAQHAPEDCASVSDANLPPGFKAWAGQGAKLAAADGATDAMPSLALEKAATIRLHKQGVVRFRAPPGQSRMPQDPHAGIMAVEIPSAGRWRVSASAPVWIDVVGPAGMVQSVSHGRMAPCTSIRKVVEFDLQPGRHWIQLSGNPGPQLRLMVSRAP